jgi:K+-transporting ATPase KdpF subunit
MTTLVWVGAALSAFLLGYLLFALLYPEKLG